MSWLACIRCHKQYDTHHIRYTCDCGDLLSVERPAGYAAKFSPAFFDARLSSRANVDRSGVWRFREMLTEIPDAQIITHPEGNTRLYQRDRLSQWANVEQLYFKHEGENPTGSFKDRGMTAGTTQAVSLGARAVACASTGNTSASLAAYAAHAGLKALVFIPAGKIAMGKLAQTLAYGAQCLAIRGDFDDAMRLVSEVSKHLGIYLLNSINPFRIEGQKTIAWELLQDLSWDAPDWIALPAGNLGNTSAIGKALLEAYEGGWINKLPRIASVQASGANPFYQSFVEGFQTRHKVQAETLASAIRIGDPVSYDKARQVILATRGVVTQVTDDEILAAKAHIDAAGIGCEPASACSLAGVKQLQERGVIQKTERVVCILTGNILKDPEIILKQPHIKNNLVEIDPTLAAVSQACRLTQ
jgi:threonine synthase